MIHHGEYDPDELDGFILDAEALEDEYRARQDMVSDLADRLYDSYQDMFDPTVVIDEWWAEQERLIDEMEWQRLGYEGGE